MTTKAKPTLRVTRTLSDILRLSAVVSMWPVELDSSSVVSNSPKIDHYGSSANHQSLAVDLVKLSQAMHLSSCQQVKNDSGIRLSHILVG